jgi:hypothetical protein
VAKATTLFKNLVMTARILQLARDPRRHRALIRYDGGLDRIEKAAAKPMSGFP